MAGPGPPHGATRLPGVLIDGYNAELRDKAGFVGDRASSRAFQRTLISVQNRMAARGHDPLDAPAEEFDKATVDALLRDGIPVEAATVLTTIETFANAFEHVVRRFLRLKVWRDTERIVVGGGLRDSRAGELAIGRAQVLLRLRGSPVELQPIRHHPDEAGLLGGLHLAPGWVTKDHDSFLALDIGGTNARAGLVLLGRTPANAEVGARLQWTHRDQQPTREETVAELVAMLTRLSTKARREKRALAPFVAIGCPGVIAPDGTIQRGGQNLPGNWEHPGFNLPDRLRTGLPRIGGHETVVAMHNDAVIQGLSELPFMGDVRRWGVMTMGTGLGNARFTNAG